MKLATTAKLVAVVLVVALLVVEVAADDPIFVKWLVADDPGDETIRDYWQRAAAGELEPDQLIDLGTMLFYRGWPNDAIRYFKEALDQDPEQFEAWFRIGLVKHRQGDLSGARSAYRKCLKRRSGHAWANFYLGLLEEQTGDSTAALEHFERAFKHAPELADPKFNPEILSSKLQLGAHLRHFDGERFEHSLPMPYREPAKVRQVQRQFERELEPAAPTVAEPVAETLPTATPTAGVGVWRRSTVTRQPAPDAGGGTVAGAGAADQRGAEGAPTELPTADETPYGIPGARPRAGTGGATGASPEVRSTSPEADLRPLWPGLHAIIEALV